LSGWLRKWAVSACAWSAPARLPLLPGSSAARSGYRLYCVIVLPQLFTVRTRRRIACDMPPKRPGPSARSRMAKLAHQLPSRLRDDLMQRPSRAARLCPFSICEGDRLVWASCQLTVRHRPRRGKETPLGLCRPRA
jgi:hypothetical protein